MKYFHLGVLLSEVTPTHIWSSLGISACSRTDGAEDQTFNLHHHLSPTHTKDSWEETRLLQTDQTALASGQSRATPVRSWEEDGGFRFSSFCWSWFSSSSKKSRPGSSSLSSRCRAESKEEVQVSWFTAHFKASFKPTAESLNPGGLSIFRIRLLRSTSTTQMCSTSAGQWEELSPLSSAAVCREAEIFNASNDTHFTAYSVWPVQVITPLHAHTQTVCEVKSQTLLKTFVVPPSTMTIKTILLFYSLQQDSSMLKLRCCLHWTNKLLSTCSRFLADLCELSRWLNTRVGRKHPFI